jgi:transitional endoplasmic reticulum ATPase
MKNLPAFLRKPAQFKVGSLDDIVQEYQPLLASWLIEMALCMKWYRMPRRDRLPDVFRDDDFLALTGVTPPTEQDEDGDLPSHKIATEATLVRLLKTRLDVLRQCPVGADLPLFTNVELIGGLLGLSDAEKAVLAFTTAINYFANFRSAIKARNEEMPTKRLARMIAVLTGQSEDGILAALREEGLLVASGIIVVEKSACDFEQALQLGSGFEGLMMLPHACEVDLVTRLLTTGSQPTLQLTAFPHLARDIDALRDYLQNARRGEAPGTNVLFYGPPGTGKTELAKAISAVLGMELFEIPFADLDGDPIRGEKRLRAYNLCQKLLARKQNALLMFDEIEDVFENRGRFWSFLGGGESGTAKGGKAWINRTLERNATPAIWITNDPDIDPAYLRRFDYSVRFPIPPLRIRLEIARHHLDSFAPNDDWLADIAANEHTTPAQIERAAKVARIASGDDLDRARTLVEQTLDRSATLLDQKRTPARNLLRTRYNLQFINTDADIGKLIAGLKQRPRGSFCLYGPAGTGKSELARHIADEIGKPALLRRASDLLSKWVGENEKNIAAMFAEARQQDAVLVLDEADSFLADRRGAQRSWEITQVNELLTQMEAFDGIFICTTNLMQKLDQASLRRFAFKLKFDYLDPDQRWAMFSQELARLGGDLAQSGDWEVAVRQLACLTPGDFAVPARQIELWGTAATAGEFYEQLRRECAAKEGQSHAIGFMS